MANRLSGTVDPPRRNLRRGSHRRTGYCGCWASDAGYGFRRKLRELYARNKKGNRSPNCRTTRAVIWARGGRNDNQSGAFAVFVNKTVMC